MRMLAIAAALLAVAPPALALLAPPEDFSATPVVLDPRDRAHLRIGELRYLGGWVLRSSDRRFGGISSMTVQGDRFAAISDTGMVFWLRPANGGIVLDGIRALPAGPGDSDSKENRDSESSSYDPATGRTWVGFETNNQIWRYGPGFATAEASAAPRSIADFPNNIGAETLVRLRDGRFLVIEETGDVPPNNHGNRGRLWASDPTVSKDDPIRFNYRAPEGFAITDGVELPSGHILLLHRRFTLATGVQAALTVFDPRQIREKAMIKGREIARLSPPLTVDNMEALALTEEHGRPVLWIASDDNFAPYQRSLLLRFAIDPAL